MIWICISLEKVKGNLPSRRHFFSNERCIAKMEVGSELGCVRLLRSKTPTLMSWTPTPTQWLHTKTTTEIRTYDQWNDRPSRKPLRLRKLIARRTELTFLRRLQFGDDHPKEVEELWAALCACWPKNLSIIIRYLIIVSAMAPAELVEYVSFMTLRYDEVLDYTVIVMWDRRV